MIYSTSPSVRIQPPSTLTNHNWFVEDFVQHDKWSVNAYSALMLVRMMDSCSKETLINEFKDLGVSEEYVEKVFARLEEMKLIHDVDTIEDDHLFTLHKKLSNTWSKYNWGNAADYFLSTLNYPFENYAIDGKEKDTQRMKKYVESQKDDDRYKVYDSAKRTMLPEADADFFPESLEKALVDVTKDTAVAKKLSKDDLFKVLSICFSQTGEITGGRWPRSPMVRKTTPSGGARHPTEAYVLILDVDDVEPGWYHVEIRKPSLELLKSVSYSEEELLKMFPMSYGRSPFHVSAIISLLSMFERNMYRYREPRTFRSVHMDIGHLSEVVRMTCNTLGVPTLLDYPDNDAAIEKELNLSGLDEGFMMSVSLGHFSH